MWACERFHMYLYGITFELVTDKLKTSHAYYAQVQGQMGVSGVEWCDFVVYTKKGMSVERIPFKKQYWNDLKQPSNYYFAHFIQHAAADYTKIYQVTQ